jgi:hypothetical protein
LFINHNDGAEADPPLFVPQAIGLGYLALRMPVGELRIGYAPYRYGPGSMGCQMITTDAQYLGIAFLEAAVVPPERDGLLRSPTGEVEHVKRQDDVFFAAVLAQGNITFAGRGEGKIRSDLTNFCRHMSPFLRMVRALAGAFPVVGRGAL